MDWVHIVPITISAASLVLSGLTIRWSRQTRQTWERVAELRAETARMKAARLR